MLCAKAGFPGQTSVLEYGNRHKLQLVTGKSTEHRAAAPTGSHCPVTLGLTGESYVSQLRSPELSCSFTFPVV